jgi:hypothetical protein
VCPFIRRDRCGPEATGHESPELSKPPTLFVLSGLDDDARQSLKPEHPVYFTATHALERQDTWNLREHAAFWTAMLTAWPRAKGGRSTVDSLSAASEHLRRHGVTADDEVALALFVAPGTVRAGPSDSRRARPNLERGAVLLDDVPDHGLTLRRRALGVSVTGEPPLPRVYDDADREPAFTYVNPLLIVERPPNHYLELAHDYLHSLWAAGDSRVRGRT